MAKSTADQPMYLKTCFPEIRTADYDGRRLEHIEDADAHAPSGEVTMDYEGDRSHCTILWTPICNEVALHPVVLQPPTITHASLTPNPEGGALLSLAGRDLGDDIEDVLSIRVGTVDCTAIGHENNGTLLSATCEPSEPQWVRGYVNVETALGGAGQSCAEVVAWVGAEIDGGAADAVLNGSGTTLAWGGCGFFNLLQGTIYEDGEADPAEIKTSGDSFVTPFFAKTCEPGSAGCGWFVLPIGTPVFDTGQMLSKPPAGAPTAFNYQTCTQGSAGCGYFKLPEGTLYDDGSLKTAGAADVLYLLTCFPQEGGRRRLTTSQPGSGPRRLSEDEDGPSFQDPPWQYEEYRHFEGPVYTDASDLAIALADAELADAAEIVLSFVGTPDNLATGELCELCRVVSRALSGAENLAEELAGLGDAQGDYVEAIAAAIVAKIEGATANSTAASGPLVRCLSVYKLTSALDKGVSKPAKLLGDKARRLIAMLGGLLSAWQDARDGKSGADARARRSCRVCAMRSTA